VNKTIKIKDKHGVACGCEYQRLPGEREQISRMCMEHEQEFIVRHAAAVASGSHANHDLVGA
jgi:hypothetical protein